MDWSAIQQIDLNKLFQLFVYNKQQPLLFNSALFLLLFVAFLAVYPFIAKRVAIRTYFIVFFSIYFYYKSSGFYFLLMLFSTVTIHYWSIFMYKQLNKSARKFNLIATLVFNLGLLIYFKYTNFFIDIANNFLTKPLSFAQIFLPLGISFYTFELISYTVDVYKNKIKPVKKLIDFCFYVSFFPHLVAGPIVRPKEFLPQIRAKLNLTKEDIGLAVFYIISGLFKKAVISDYISSNFVDRIFDNPTLYSGVENLLGVYGYTLQIYCDFSGYSDMAIGIALLIGFKLPNNFNTPYIASNVTDFWRRWHISLSTWLRDYLYIPLGGNRVGAIRQNFNLFITMLLGGLWHGASWKFIFWGAMHGAVLVTEKAFNKLVKLPKNKIVTFLSILLTFHFVSFCWIFFRANSFQSAWEIVFQVINNLNFSLLIDVIKGYKEVFILIGIGYLLHFLPTIAEQKFKNTIIKSNILLQSLYLVIIIWLVIQAKSSQIQPFIYFQF